MKLRNKGITLAYIYTFLNMVFGLFLSSFLLRMLGDTNYGVYQAIASFANYLILFEFGMGTVMTRNISICMEKKTSIEEIEKNVSTIWTITNILNVLIISISCIFYISIPKIYSASLTEVQMVEAQRIFILITLNLVASFYVQTLNGMTMGYERYTYGTIQKIVKLILRVSILAVAITIFKDALMIALTDAVLGVGVLCHAIWYVIRKLKIKLTFSKFDAAIFKEITPLCIALFLQTIVNQANNNVDKFIISIVMTPEKVALYSVALYIFTVFSSLTTIPISFYSPQIAKDITSGVTLDSIHECLNAPCRFVSLLGGTILFGFVACGHQFVEIVYGTEYVFAWELALVLMLPMHINMVNGILVNVLDVLNKRIIRSFILIITTIANIVLTIFWIRSRGLIGAVMATAICTFLGQVLIMNTYYKKALGIRVITMLKNAFHGILIFQILGAICALIVRMMVSNVFISFVVCGITYVAIFSCGYLFFGANAEERELIRRFFVKNKH